MTYQETKQLFQYIAALYPNAYSGKSDDAKRLMLRSWAEALQDVALQPCCDGVRQGVLEGQKFPPSSPAELLERAQAFLPVKIERWDVQFARSCHDCLGLDTPLYRQHQAWILPAANIEKLQ